MKTLNAEKGSKTFTCLILVKIVSADQQRWLLAAVIEAGAIGYRDGQINLIV